MTKAQLANKLISTLTRFEVCANQWIDVPWEETHERVLKEIGMTEKEFKEIVDMQFTKKRRRK